MNHLIHNHEGFSILDQLLEAADTNVEAGAVASGSPLAALLSLYITERDNFYWRCHCTKWFAPITNAMPLTVLVPNLRVRADMGKTERFMDTNAPRVG